MIIKKFLISLLVLVVTLQLGYTTDSIAQSQNTPGSADNPGGSQGGPGESDNNNNSPSGDDGNPANFNEEGNAGGNNSPAIPIDGGLGLLLAAGVGFGIKTVRNRKK